MSQVYTASPSWRAERRPPSTRSERAPVLLIAVAGGVEDLLREINDVAAQPAQERIGAQ